jgi:tetratricopeptide (TPR) repeat protein
LPSLKQALAIWDRLAHGEPRYRLQLARTLGRIGRGYTDGGSADEALMSLDRARELLEQLRRETPGDLTVARILAEAWWQIGYVHRARTHRTEESLNAFRRCGEIWDRLARENPEVVEFPWRRMVAIFWLGDALSEAGRSAEAVTVLQPAIAEGERMVASAPSEFTWRRDLAKALVALGKAFLLQGHAADSVAPLTRARTLLDALRNADPDNPTYLTALARCIRFLGRVFHTLRKYDEAIQTLTAGASSWRKPRRKPGAGATPSFPTWLSFMENSANSSTRPADSQMPSGRWRRQIPSA